MRVERGVRERIGNSTRRTAAPSFTGTPTTSIILTIRPFITLSQPTFLTNPTTSLNLSTSAIGMPSTTNTFPITSNLTLTCPVIIPCPFHLEPSTLGFLYPPLEPHPLEPFPRTLGLTTLPIGRHVSISRSGLVVVIRAHGDVVSLFVSNFPEECGTKEVFKWLHEYGRIIDLYIPNRRTKVGRRFGFVKFLGMGDARKLVATVDQLWVGMRKIRANLVRVEKGSDKGVGGKSVPNDVSSKRSVWIQIFGVPLHVWNIKTFSTLACRIGEVKQVDKMTLGKLDLEKGRVRVITPIMNPIEKTVKTRVSNEDFTVSLLEENETFHMINANESLSESEEYESSEYKPLSSEEEEDLISEEETEEEALKRLTTATDNNWISEDEGTGTANEMVLNNRSLEENSIKELPSPKDSNGENPRSVGVLPADSNGTVVEVKLRVNNQVTNKVESLGL